MKCIDALRDDSALAEHECPVRLVVRHAASKRQECPEEIASLDRLRRLVANLRGEELLVSTSRVAEFLRLAERRLASREAAPSADGLEQRFEKNKLFGDEHAFRPPYGYY